MNVMKPCELTSKLYDCSLILNTLTIIHRVLLSYVCVCVCVFMEAVEPEYEELLSISNK